MSAWAFTLADVDVVTGVAGAAVEVTLVDGGVGGVGPQGPQGEQGPTGPTGPQGATGPQGEQGPTGATGPQGPAGTDSTVAGPQGEQGPQGETGPQGPAGLQGPAGPAGADGSDADVTAHEAAVDPHPQYATDAALTTALDANSTADRDRANHTGTQTAASIADFTEAVQDAVAALLGAGSNVTLFYDDAADTLTVSAAGGGSGLDAEAVRDAIGVALVGVGLVAVTVDDAADTITISTTATANSTDAQLRDRSTHTGTQAIATVTGLQAALDGKVDTSRQIIAGTGLSGGGTLAADRTLTVQYGTTAGTAAQGNDPRFDTVPDASVDDTKVKGTANISLAKTVDSTASTGRLAMTNAERTKLTGVATGATANSSDATLLARGNHTGTQAISTVSGLQTALDGKASTAQGVPAGGTAGQVLAKASGADYATTWTDPSTGGGGGSAVGGWTFYQESVVSAASQVEVTGISGCTELRVEADLVMGANATIYLRLNGDSNGLNYHFQRVGGSGSTTTSARFTPAGQIQPHSGGTGLRFHLAAQIAKRLSTISASVLGTTRTGTGSGIAVDTFAGEWLNTSSEVTAVRLVTAFGETFTGRLRVYGRA